MTGKESTLYTGNVPLKMAGNLTRSIYLCMAVALAGLISGPEWAKASAIDLAETAGAIRTWHGSDGLPSDSATAITQTRDGFIWVGTTAGLVRFDGLKFSQLKLESASPANPVHVTALCEDSNGHLWIGTLEDGVFELAEGALSHYAREHDLLDVTSLAADSHGQVWIGGKNGLKLWTGREFKSFGKRDGLSDEFVSGLNVAHSGAVWITTRTGMCRFLDGRIARYEFQPESQGRSPEYLGTYEDHQGNLWAFGDTYLINLAEGKRFNYFRSSESASVRIWSLCEGRAGRIWIGTSGRGLFCFEDGRFQPVVLGENRWPYDVRAIFEDRDGNLWLGTSGGGVTQLRPHSVHIVRAETGLPKGQAVALAVDDGGQACVGLQQGGIFTGQGGRFDRIGHGPESPDFISSVCMGRDGAVWAGTLGDGLYGWKNGRAIHFSTANCLPDDNILDVVTDGEGALWIAFGSGILSRFADGTVKQFGPESGLPGTTVTTMTVSQSGLYLGTQDGQMAREEGGRFMKIDALTGLGGDAILALREDAQRRLWIGTFGGGLACLSNNMLAIWNTNNGLPSAIVAGVVEDQASDLWLAMDTGIYRVTRSEVEKALASPVHPLKCELISEVKTTPDPSAITGGFRAARGAAGELWFATAEGVVNIDTHEAGPEQSRSIPRIEFMSVDGNAPVTLLTGALWSPASPSTNMFETPTDLRSLDIGFTALDFDAPEEIRFRHKLDGFETEWVDDGGSRTVHYSRLPYGTYRFRVAARIANGPWEEAAEIFAFIVPTPFYFQAWALWLFGLTAVAFVVGVVRGVSHRRLRVALARLEQQQALERERMRIARDMHDEMGSKLTKISFLSERAKADAEPTGILAGKIESIAQTSRELLQTMDEIVWVVNPHNDTLENLVVYLSHYAVEYFQNTTIECEMRLPHEIPQRPLASEARHNLFLTFEEALNNVLKHSGATTVKVDMIADASAFEAAIADNGIGFDEASLPAHSKPAGPRRGDGLRNMRQRLGDIGGECLITSRPGNGTIVRMRFPLNKKTSVKK